MAVLFCHPNASCATWLLPGAAPEWDVHRRMIQNWGMLERELACWQRKLAWTSELVFQAREWQMDSFCYCCYTANLAEKVANRDHPQSTPCPKIKAYVYLDSTLSALAMYRISSEVAVWYLENGPRRSRGPFSRYQTSHRWRYPT